MPPDPPDDPVALRSGDGFLRCSDGHTRWGLYGAAGVVFTLAGGRGPEVLVQLRSALAHEGGTWSCPGGAIDRGESPIEAALREAEEEVGRPPEPWQVVGEHVFAPATDWTYTTAVVAVPARFGTSLTFETDDVRWVPVDEVEALPLHPGFAAAWPFLREIVRDDPPAARPESIRQMRSRHPIRNFTGDTAGMRVGDVEDGSPGSA